MGTPQQLPERTDRVEDADVPRDYLRQHRLEDEVVLAVHQRDLDRCALGDEAFEVERGIDPPETTAQHDHPCGPHRVITSARPGRVEHPGHRYLLAWRPPPARDCSSQDL